MSGKTFVIICSLLFVQLALARVARDAPAEQENPFLEFFTKAVDASKAIQEKVLESFGVKDQEELNKYAADKSKNFANQLGNLLTDLKKTADENVEKIGESDAVKQLRARVDEAINNLKKENPETANNIEQLTKTSKSLVENISKIGDSESAKQIKDIGNQILQATTDTLKDLSQKIQESGKSS